MQIKHCIMSKNTEEMDIVFISLFLFMRGKMNNDRVRKNRDAKGK